MHIVLQFINNQVEKIKITNVNNYKFYEARDIDNCKPLVLSRKLGEKRIYNPFIINLVNENILIDRIYISAYNLDLSLYSDIVEFYRRELFNDYIDFKTKKYSYRFYIDEEKTNDDHILTIRNIVVKRRDKNSCFKCKL